MTIAIPRGYVLVSLFFLVYVRGLPRLSESLFMESFGEDTYISLSNFNYLLLVRKFNEEIYKVSEWLNTNRLNVIIKAAFIPRSKWSFVQTNKCS